MPAKKLGPLLGLLKKNWNFCRRPYAVCRRARRKKKTAPNRRKRLFFPPTRRVGVSTGPMAGWVGEMRGALGHLLPPSPIRPPNWFNGLQWCFNGPKSGVQWGGSALHSAHPLPSDHLVGRWAGQ